MDMDLNEKINQRELTENNEMSKENYSANNSGGKEILLNLMFRGKFLQDNIGHEIINMFPADDGKYYIYVNPYGTFHKSHSGKIETILLGRYAGDNCIEIIAKAEELEEIVKVDGDDKTIRCEQEKYCENNHICYGGKRIIQIFNVNENQNKHQLAWVSFLCKKYSKVRKEKKLFITDTKERENISENIYFIGNPDATAPIIRFPKQSLKAYYAKDSDETGAAYCALNKIVNDNSLWENGPDEIEKQKITQDAAEDKYSNFLKLIHKENDELSFSNLLAHYLSHRFELMIPFAKEVLGLDLGNFYKIEREWKNIDLLIEDDMHVIVIENKIKSKINGIRHDIDSKEVRNQLGKYIEEAHERAKSKGGKPEKKTKFYIFFPNYNHIDLKPYEGGDQYTTVLYSKIYDFFIEYQKIKTDRFFDDFLRALYKHTLPYADDLYGEMLQKFAESIYRNNENKM